MKQTAVEWLYNNLKSHFEHDGDLLESVQISMQQAKEMEKEQMVDFAFKYGDLTTREIADSFDKEYKTNEK
jgi:hypothetical protein